MSEVDAGEAAPTAPSKRGTLLAGRYRIDEPIAAGGMGEVWRATDEVLGRVVSVKFLHSQYATNETFLERMLREARAASAVNHPGVVATYDFGRIQEEGQLPSSYIVMEYVDGPSLSTLLLDGPLSLDQSLMILEQTSAALDAAHRAGVVHRDVKPGNILLTPEGNVKLTDFGIARSEDTSTITDSGSIAGTAQYLSPEQAAGEKADDASDFYSLGVVIYSCLTGAVPFVRDSPVAIALAHIQEKPPPLPEHIPAGVSELVMSLLEKEPSDRPASGAVISARAARLRRELPLEATDPAATVPAAAAAAAADTDPEATEIASAPPGEGRRFRPRTGVILLALAAAAAVVGLVLMFATRGEEVTMPSVVGLTQQQAEGNLKDIGLDTEIEVKDVAKTKKDVVVGQSEDAGSTVRTGDTVTLTVASGMVAIPVDKIIGASYEDARAILEDLGLEVAKTSKVSGAKAGTVIDIGGSTERADVGSTITLTVAKAEKKKKVEPTFAPTPTAKPKPTPKPTKTTPPPSDTDGAGTDGTDTSGASVDGTDTSGTAVDGTSAGG